tara:strand:+ start:559 stop:1059 length:501 start_codon:yes stop_codon:yes gene_type:complete
MPQYATIRIINEVQPAATGDFTSGGSVTLVSDIRLTDGTAAFQSDRCAFDSRTLGASASEDLDLKTMVATAGGAALGLAELRSITIKASATNSDNITVGPGASNGFLGFLADASDRLIIPPGTTFTIAGGQDGKMPVGSSTKTISVTNSSSSASASYSILLLGVSA